MNEPLLKTLAIRLITAYAGIPTIIGIIIIFSVLYVIDHTPGNIEDPQCLATVEKAQTLDNKVRGEIAGFVLAEKPLSLANLTFQNEAGTTRHLRDFAGKNILLNIWATWCPPCRKEMPSLSGLQKKVGGYDFEVIAVNIDTEDAQKPKDFLKETGISNLIYYADPTTKIFGTLRRKGKAYGLPATILLDKQACVVGHLNGAADWDSVDALTLVRAMMKQL